MLGGEGVGGRVCRARWLAGRGRVSGRMRQSSEILPWLSRQMPRERATDSSLPAEYGMVPIRCRTSARKKARFGRTRSSAPSSRVRLVDRISPKAAIGASSTRRKWSSVR